MLIISSADGTSKKAGTIGHIGCTSFFPSKNLGCYGDGGAIFTNDDELAKQLRVVVNHGMTVRYYHDFIGVNSRLDSIQAAILGVKLKHLDEYASRRRSAADYYDKAFAGNPKLKVPCTVSTGQPMFFTNIHWCSTNVDRKGLQDFLADQRDPCNDILSGSPAHAEGIS